MGTAPSPTGRKQGEHDRRAARATGEANCQNPAKQKSTMQHKQNSSSAPTSSATTNLNTLASGDRPSPESLVAQFFGLRDRLVERQQTLEVELGQIRSALQDIRGDHPVPVLAIEPPVRTRRPRTGLGAAVCAALGEGPLTKEQILEKLESKGVVLPGNPRVAINTVIYSKRFQRDGKLFCLAEKTA